MQLGTRREKKRPSFFRDPWQAQPGVVYTCGRCSVTARGIEYGHVVVPKQGSNKGQRPMLQAKNGASCGAQGKWRLQNYLGTNSEPTFCSLKPHYCQGMPASPLSETQESRKSSNKFEVTTLILWINWCLGISAIREIRSPHAAYHGPTACQLGEPLQSRGLHFLPMRWVNGLNGFLRPLHLKNPLLYLPWEVWERAGGPQIAWNYFTGFKSLNPWILPTNYILFPPPPLLNRKSEVYNGYRTRPRSHR